jgi:hypothetical protein
MVVSEDQLANVFDADTALGQACFERGQGLGRFGAGVNKSEWVTFDQISINRADRKARRENNQLRFHKV